MLYEFLKFYEFISYFKFKFWRIYQIQILDFFFFFKLSKQGIWILISQIQFLWILITQI